MRHLTIPRSIVGGSVFAAAGDSAQILAQLQEAHSQFVSVTRGRIDGIEAAVNDLAVQTAAFGLNGGGGMLTPVEPEYTSAFAAYVRKGDGLDILKSANSTGDRATVHAAMSVGTATDGGYLAPVEFDRQVFEKQRVLSPMRRIARVQLTSVGAYTSVWSDKVVGSGWVGETAARPATTTPGLSQIPFPTGEIYANAAATQRLLDDGVINVEQWLVEQIADEFARQESLAFISGDGVNKPSGLLTHATGGANAAAHPGGPLTVVDAAIGYDSLVDFTYGLEAPYRQNATWLMSSLTAAAIAKLKNADGDPIWREGLVVGQPATLLGRPVEIDEAMPAPTAGNIAIAFGDFRAGYVINDRTGVRTLRDPFTNKPFVHFYTTKRVGGGVLDPFAIRLLRVPV